MKRVFVFLLIAILLVVSLPCVGYKANADEIIKLSDKKGNVEIKKSGMNIIPVDYEEESITGLTIKCNSEKSIIFYLDIDGIHIVPMAAGKTILTISGRSNKKVKLDLTVTVAKDVVANLDKEPLTAFAMIDHSYALPADKPIIKYFIYGGAKPYQKAEYAIQEYNYNGFGGGVITNQKPKPYYSSKHTIEKGVELVQGELKVVDAEMNVVQVSSNGLTVLNDLWIIPEYIPYIMPAGEKISIPYTIIGGSGNFSTDKGSRFITEWTDVGWENDKTKNNGSADSLNISASKAELVRYKIVVKDKKTKNEIHFGPVDIVLSDKTVKGYIDQTVVHVGDTVKMRFEFSEKPSDPPKYIWFGYNKSDGIYSSSDNNAVNMKETKVDECTYTVEYTLLNEGFYWLGLLTDGFANDGNIRPLVKVYPQ